MQQKLTRWESISQEVADQLGPCSCGADRNRHRCAMELGGYCHRWDEPEEEEGTGLVEAFDRFRQQVGAMNDAQKGKEPGWPSPEELARAFHEAYERLAPDYGYKTREASAVPWDDVPTLNKRLMIATAAEVLEQWDW